MKNFRFLERSAISNPKFPEIVAARTVKKSHKLEIKSELFYLKLEKCWQRAFSG